MKKNKYILILSGGMDSTTLLYHLLAEGNSVKCLGVDYGQKHKRELNCAFDICDRLKVQFEVADLRSLTKFMSGSSQTDDTVLVPHGHYAAENMKQTVVPFRNGLMLSAAATWAIGSKADFIAFAAHCGDHAIYPDCREEFASSFNTTLLLGDWHQVRLARPFVNMTKTDIVRRGFELGVPFVATHTCYEGNEVACGRCGTCVERLESFAQVGISDPLKYADREFFKTCARIVDAAKKVEVRG